MRIVPFCASCFVLLLLRHSCQVTGAVTYVITLRGGYYTQPLFADDSSGEDIPTCFWRRLGVLLWYDAAWTVSQTHGSCRKRSGLCHIGEYMADNPTLLMEITISEK